MEARYRKHVYFYYKTEDGDIDSVAPTEDIFSGLYKLTDLHKEYGKAWQQLYYKVKLNEDGNWSYEIDFKY